jgi:hypothetical protein
MMIGGELGEALCAAGGAATVEKYEERVAELESPSTIFLCQDDHGRFDAGNVSVVASWRPSRRARSSACWHGTLTRRRGHGRRVSAAPGHHNLSVYAGDATSASARSLSSTPARMPAKRSSPSSINASGQYCERSLGRPASRSRHDDGAGFWVARQLTARLDFATTRDGFATRLWV